MIDLLRALAVFPLAAWHRWCEWRDRRRQRRREMRMRESWLTQIYQRERRD